MTAPQKDYELIEFSFSKPSGRRNGKHFEVTAFLLIPSDEVAAFNTAIADPACDKPALYEALLGKGALLHRDNGPAYKEVEVSAFNRNHAETKREEYWQKGVQSKSGAPGISHGKFRF